MRISILLKYGKKGGEFVSDLPSLANKIKINNGNNLIRNFLKKSEDAIKEDGI